LEKIWRRHACIARNALPPILRFVISSIAVIENVKKPGSESGRRRSWQATATIETTKLRLRGSGAAGTKITGSGTERTIQPTRREIAWLRRSVTGGGDPGQRLQRWTS